MKSDAVPHNSFREGFIVGYQLIRGISVGVPGASGGPGPHGGTTSFLLGVEAQAEVERYLAKEFEAAELVNRIIRLFDGPDQRRAQQLARGALAEG